MRKKSDLSNAERKPQASQLRKPITIRLEEDAIDYFKSVSERVGIPYQSLISLYLRDCATSQRQPDLSWKELTLLDPSQFVPNQAWIVFQLNAKPVRTVDDGDFHCMALMDAATGLIVGSEMVRAGNAEPTQMEARRLLKMAIASEGGLPKTLLAATGMKCDWLLRAAGPEALDVVRVPLSSLLPFIGEAQAGFRERFG